MACRRGGLYPPFTRRSEHTLFLVSRFLMFFVVSPLSHKAGVVRCCSCPIGALGFRSKGTKERYPVNGRSPEQFGVCRLWVRAAAGLINPHFSAPLLYSVGAHCEHVGTFARCLFLLWWRAAFGHQLRLSFLGIPLQDELLDDAAFRFRGWIIHRVDAGKWASGGGGGAREALYPLDISRGRGREGFSYLRAASAPRFSSASPRSGRKSPGSRHTPCVGSFIFMPADLSPCVIVLHGFAGRYLGKLGIQPA